MATVWEFNAENIVAADLSALSGVYDGWNIDAAVYRADPFGTGRPAVDLGGTTGIIWKDAGTGLPDNRTVHYVAKVGTPGASLANLLYGAVGSGTGGVSNTNRIACLIGASSFNYETYPGAAVGDSTLAYATNDDVHVYSYVSSAAGTKVYFDGELVSDPEADPDTMGITTGSMRVKMWNGGTSGFCSVLYATALDVAQSQGQIRAFVDSFGPPWTPPALDFVTPVWDFDPTPLDFADGTVMTDPFTLGSMSFTNSASTPMTLEHDSMGRKAIVTETTSGFFTTTDEVGLLPATWVLVGRMLDGSNTGQNPAVNLWGIDEGPLADGRLRFWASNGDHTPAYPTNAAASWDPGAMVILVGTIAATGEAKAYVNGSLVNTKTVSPYASALVPTVLPGGEIYRAFALDELLDASAVANLSMELHDIYVKGQVTVGWAAPEQNGGSAITGYRVTYYSDDRTVLSTVQVAANVTEATLVTTGAGTVAVQAINAVGTSAPAEIHT